MKRFRSIFILLGILLLLRLLATQKPLIEQLYSRGFYVLWRKITHWLFDGVSISVGDIAYVALGVYLLYLLLQIVRRKPQSGIRLLRVSLLLFLGFQLSWGLNYHRITLASQWELDAQKVDSMDLYRWTEHLIALTNASHRQLSADSTAAIVWKQAVPDWQTDLQIAYRKLNQKHSELQLLPTYPKASLHSNLLSYMGFSGYLNPFTLEAQTNDKMPSYQQVFTSAHEMAHQMGIGSESECNLLAYLACAQSDNPKLNYSAYATSLRYALRHVYAKDSLRMRAYEQRLLPGVRANYQQSKEFWLAHQNPMDVALEHFYDRFLKANSQSDGMKGYSRFVPLALQYQQRFEGSSVEAKP